MTGSAAQEVCVSIVHFTPNDIAAPTSVSSTREVPLAHIAFICIAAFTCRDPGLHRLNRIEKCTFKPQSLDDFRACDVGENPAAHLLQQKAQRDESQIAIDDSCSGR